MKLTEIGSAPSAPNIIRNLGSSGAGEWSTASKRKTKEELKQQRIDRNKQQLTQRQADWLVDVREEIETNVPAIYEICHIIGWEFRGDRALSGAITRFGNTPNMILNAIDEYDIKHINELLQRYEDVRQELLHRPSKYGNDRYAVQSTGLLKDVFLDV